MPRTSRKRKLEDDIVIDENNVIDADPVILRPTKRQRLNDNNRVAPYGTSSFSTNNNNKPIPYFEPYKKPHTPSKPKPKPQTDINSVITERKNHYTIPIQKPNTIGDSMTDYQLFNYFSKNKNSDIQHKSNNPNKSNNPITKSNNPVNHSNNPITDSNNSLTHSNNTSNPSNSNNVTNSHNTHFHIHQPDLSGLGNTETTSENNSAYGRLKKLLGL